jgi:hypothetical protein
LRRFVHVENDLYLPDIGTLESSNVLADTVQQLLVEDKSPQEAATWGQQKIQEVLGAEASSELN